MEVGVEY